MSILRKAAAFLCILAILLVPAPSSVGGDGGLVNLPGGGGRHAKQVRSTNQNIIMVLPRYMVGSVAYVVGGPAGGVVTVPTVNGTFLLPSATMRGLMAAGANMLEITFVSPSGTHLVVHVLLNKRESTATLTINP